MIPVKKVINRDEERKLVDFYNQGIGSSKIGKIFNCHDVTVRRHLRKNGIEIRSHTKVTPTIKTGIMNLYGNGLSTQKIAKLLDLGTNTVRYHLQKAGIKLRSRPVISPKIEEKFIEYYKTNMHISQISKIFNLSDSTVRRYLIKRNVKMKPIGKRKDISPTAGILTPEKAYILGTIGPGDGFIEFNRKSQVICLEATDKDFVDYFAHCLEKVYGIRPIFKLLKPRLGDTKPHYKIKLHSVEACRDLFSYNVSFREKDWEVPEEIKDANEELKGIYLKGMADSQGTVCHHGYTKWIQLSSKNQEGLKEIGNLLNSLGILDWYIHENGLRISSRRSLSPFFEKVGFIIKRKSRKLKELLESYKVWQRPKKEMVRIAPEIYTLWKNGLNPMDISKKLEITHSTVYRYIKTLKTKNSEEQIEFLGIK